MPFLLSDLSLLRDYFKIFPGNNQQIYTTYRGNVPRLPRLRGRASECAAVSAVLQDRILWLQDCLARGGGGLQKCKPGMAAPTPS